MLKKQRNFFIFIIFINLFLSELFAQNLNNEAIQRAIFNIANTEKKNIKDFFAREKQSSKKNIIKIMVLPFFNNEKKVDENSEKIAILLANIFQNQIFNNKENDIIIYDYREFSRNEGTSILETFKNSKVYDDSECKQLIDDLVKPDYYIEGNYSITKSSGKKSLEISNLNIKSYIEDNSQIKISKLSLKPLVIPLEAQDFSLSMAKAYTAKISSYDVPSAIDKARRIIRNKIIEDFKTEFINFNIDDTKKDEFFIKVVDTYWKEFSNMIEKNVISEQDQNAEVLCTLDKLKIDMIYDNRIKKVKKLIEDALIAENELNISLACMNYYSAYAYWSTIPKYDIIEIDVNNNKMTYLKLFQKLEDIAKNINIDVNKIEQDNNKTKIYVNITYKNKPVNSLKFCYQNGSIYTDIETSDNTALLILNNTNVTALESIYWYPVFINNELCKMDPVMREISEFIPTNFLKKQKIIIKDKTVDKITDENINIKITEKKINPTLNATTVSISKKENSSITQENQTSGYSKEVPNKEEYFNIVSEVIQAIINKKPETVINRFTDDGYNDLKKLLNYGDLHISKKNIELSAIKINEYVQVRSVPITFKFKNNVIFNENLVFNFVANSKLISNLSFSLKNNALKDIIEKSGWTDLQKFQIVNFIENYQTAFAFEDINYINQIFSADAKIITVSRKLENSQLKPEQKLLVKEIDNYKYSEMNKEQYLKHLNNIFKNNDYINILFGNNRYQKHGKYTNVFGIQIKQNYYSETYSDEGYLFLLIDISDEKKPQIIFRSWQPQADVDGIGGKIFGLDDFSF